MLWRLRAGKEIPLGVAWEEGEVRIVDLQPAGAGYRVNTLSFSLPQGNLVTGTGNDQSSLVDLLKRVRRDNRWGKRAVVTALPPNQVLIRYLKLPAPQAEKMEQAICREARQLLGNRLEDYSFDYMVLDRENIPQDRKELTVLVAAVPREKALFLYELFSRAGFRLQAIDIVPLALKRALLDRRVAEQGTEPVVLLDLGRNTAQLAVVTRGQLSFARSWPCCLPAGTEEETARDDISFLSKAKELLTELQRSLDYFQAQSRQKAAELIVSGTGCRWPGLLALLQESELKVEQGVPGHGLTLDRPPDPSFAVAMGLALKGAFF